MFHKFFEIVLKETPPRKGRFGIILSAAHLLNWEKNAASIKFLMPQLCVSYLHFARFIYTSLFLYQVFISNRNNVRGGWSILATELVRHRALPPSKLYREGKRFLFAKCRLFFRALY